jgi:hypothetical protein
MSNDQWKLGPQSYAEAANMAQQSQTQFGPDVKVNTSNWSAPARDNYYKNGGK